MTHVDKTVTQDPKAKPGCKELQKSLMVLGDKMT